MMSYLQFHGGQDEDVMSFENLELACTSNHKKDPMQILPILQTCLKRDARA